MFSTVYWIIFTIYAMFFIGIAAIIIRRTKQTTKEAKELCGELKRQLAVNLSLLLCE